MTDQSDEHMMIGWYNRETGEFDKAQPDLAVTEEQESAALADGPRRPEDFHAEPRRPRTPQLPILPYAGTSGHSGSDTSKARAEGEDAEGTTTARQRITLMHLERFGRSGATWKELAAITGWHHGQASGALSVLHKVGLIARLAEKRSRCCIYVLPQYVDDRETQPHGGRFRQSEHRYTLAEIKNGTGFKPEAVFVQVEGL